MLASTIGLAVSTSILSAREADPGLTTAKVFGFAYTDALQAHNHTNIGLRDQRAAFECESILPTESALRREI